MAERKNMSKMGFILSAVGAAVGLGNLWGFPTKMMTWGGPAFLVPYVFAVVVLGLPFLILEINLGSKWRKAPVNFYGEYLGKFGKPFAWMQATIQLMIGAFYGVIIAWVVVSIGVSFTGYLGEEGFFGSAILGNETKYKGTSFYGLGKIQPIVFIAFLGVICLTGLVVSLGISRGIEAANKLMVPFLFFLIILIFAYSLTLKGAGNGLEMMFKPQFGKLGDLGAWRAAFSQAFFTLSLAVSVIVVYSVYSPKGGDNTNRAITIMSGDTLIALLACVIVAATLGYSQGAGIVEIKGKTVSFVGKTDTVSGSAFVFKVFPQTFKKMNESVKNLGQVVGFCFYLALFFAAMSSMISLLEPAVTNLDQGHGISRFKAVILICLVQFVFGLVFSFQGGHGLMDITDGYYTTYLLLPSAVIMGAMVAASKKKMQELTDLNNKTSMYKLGGWYRYLIMFCVLLTLTILVLGIYANIESNAAAQFNGFQWGLLTFLYFFPFSIFVFGFGCSDFWKKLFKRGK